MSTATDKKDKKRKKVGEYSWELQQKQDEKINPIDLQREIHKGNSSDDSYENQVRIAVDRGKDEFPNDFFVVVLFKKERILQNVVRQYFLPRESCPTPEYDQVVYKYHAQEDRLELIWVVPDQASVYELPQCKHELPIDQWALVHYCEDLLSGKLDALAQRLNKEYEKTWVTLN